MKIVLLFSILEIFYFLYSNGSIISILAPAFLIFSLSFSINKNAKFKQKSTVSSTSDNVETTHSPFVEENAFLHNEVKNEEEIVRPKSVNLKVQDDENYEILGDSQLQKHEVQEYLRLAAEKLNEQNTETKKQEDLFKLDDENQELKAIEEPNSLFDFNNNASEANWLNPYAETSFQNDKVKNVTPNSYAHPANWTSPIPQIPNIHRVDDQLTMPYVQKNEPEAEKIEQQEKKIEEDKENFKLNIRRV